MTTTQNTIAKYEELKVFVKTDIPAGYRVSKIIRKGEGNISTGSHVALLTTDDIVDVMSNDKGAQYIRECLEAVQDKIARKFMDENKTNEVGMDLFNVCNIIEWVSQESENKGRLSKDAIEKWFMSDLASHIQEALKAKGLSSVQIEQTIQAFKGYFGSLAARSVSMNEKIKAQLEKAIALLPDTYESELGERIIAKLLDVKEATAEFDAL